MKGVGWWRGGENRTQERGWGAGGRVMKGLSIVGLKLLVLKLEGVGALRGGFLVLHKVCEREVVCGDVYTFYCDCVALVGAVLFAHFWSGQGSRTHINTNRCPKLWLSLQFRDSEMCQKYLKTIYLCRINANLVSDFGALPSAIAPSHSRSPCHSLRRLV